MKKLHLKSKSPVKTHNESIFKSPAPKKQQAEENALLEEIKTNFDIHINQKIMKIDAMAKTELPLRCLIHNNMISLYCQIDRHPLCANCMYETQKHRNHRVVPLEKAQSFIKEDITSFKNKVNGIASAIQKQWGRIKERSVEAEKNYEQWIQSIKKFYRDFKEMIELKEKMQIIELEDAKERIKTENFIMCKEIQLIISKISDNAKLFSAQKFPNRPLITRNILETLIEAKHIVKSIQNLETPQNKYQQLNLQQYNRAYSFVYEKLVLSVPIPTKKKLTGIRTYQQQDQLLDGRKSLYRSKIQNKSVEIMSGRSKSKSAKHHRNQKRKVTFNF